MSSHNVLVLATGGDDGALALLKRCEDDGAAERWWVTLQGDTRLRIEHALSLTRADLCLFLLDETSAGAALEGGAGRDREFSLRPVTHGSSHLMASSESAMSPEDLLHTLATLGRHGRKPRCYALTLESGTAGDAGLARALAFLTDLLKNPDANYWDDRVG